MRTIDLNYKEAHQLVDSRPNMFWDGWTLVVVDTRRDGMMHKRGIYFHDKWALQERYSVLPTGKWRLPAKHV